MLNRLKAIRLWLLLMVIMVLAAAAYWPGLAGGFLFDDFANLPSLGATGPIHDNASFWRYITSGTADPTGRPLTLLTFLLDARDWPASPYPFKRTNLILHLLNGVLLFALLYQLSERMRISSARAQLAALLGSAFWLLHPLLVSTTLYIVQREAMLPATCILSGLLIWLHGRTCLDAGKIRSGVVWTLLGLGAFTALAILTKANGALLPVYALLIEGIVLAKYCPLSDAQAAKANRILLIVLGVIPAVVLASYLIWVALHGLMAGGPAHARPWTIAQRLMTEPRVLLDYLKLLWIPRPFSSGLFNDQYVASTSWLNPASTLPAAVILLALLTLAWFIRKKHPALALTLFFYFAGQSLESSSVPLELYFEHRNYVPALLMFWPLGLWLTDLNSLRAPKLLLATILPIVLACITYASASVWGDVQTQALIWARVNADSPRAQAYAGEIEMRAGRIDEAVQRLSYWADKQPDDIQLAFNLISARCLAGKLERNDLERARYAILHTYSSTSMLTKWLEQALPIAVSGQCPGLDANGLAYVISGGLENPHLQAPGQRQDFTYMLGRIELAQHHSNAALSRFADALNLEIRPDMAFQETAILGAAGYASDGLKLLDYYKHVQGQEKTPDAGMPRLHAWILARQHYWIKEQSHLEAALEHDAKTAAKDSYESDSTQDNLH